MASAKNNSDPSLGVQKPARDALPPGSRSARSRLDGLFSVAYEELRLLAAQVRRHDRNTTVNTTALVNEAWLKLSGNPGVEPESQLHFKRIAARAMRQILVEAARRRQASKRGAGPLMVSFNEDVHVPSSARELLQLDAALQELTTLNPRQAEMVESRFFGGLEVAEIAQLMDVSEATVMRDWRSARAWLARELRKR